MCQDLAAFAGAIAYEQYRALSQQIGDSDGGPSGRISGGGRLTGADDLAERFYDLGPGLGELAAIGGEDGGIDLHAAGVNHRDYVAEAGGERSGCAGGAGGDGCAGGEIFRGNGQ